MQALNSPMLRKGPLRAERKHMLSIEGIERLVEPVINGLGLVLHSVEFRREGRESILRLTVDRQAKQGPSDGVTVDELVKANEEVGALLDLENPIEERYRLTIESPGVERDLTSWRQYRYAVGERARIVTRGEDAAVYEGLLKAVSENGLEIETSEGTVEVDSTNIKSGRTVYLWEDQGGKKRKF